MCCQGQTLFFQVWRRIGNTDRLDSNFFMYHFSIFFPYISCQRNNLLLLLMFWICNLALWVKCWTFLFYFERYTVKDLFSCKTTYGPSCSAGLHFHFVSFRLHCKKRKVGWTQNFKATNFDKILSWATKLNILSFAFEFAQLCILIFVNSTVSCTNL